MITLLIVSGVWVLGGIVCTVMWVMCGIEKAKTYEDRYVLEVSDLLFYSLLNMLWPIFLLRWLKRLF